jgi:hypothetical protein
MFKNDNNIKMKVIYKLVAEMKKVVHLFYFNRLIFIIMIIGSLIISDYPIPKSGDYGLIVA